MSELNTTITLPPKSAELALKTLRDSMSSMHSILLRTGVEEVGGQPLVYFDFKEPDGNEIRLYAD